MALHPWGSQPVREAVAIEIRDALAWYPHDLSLVPPVQFIGRTTKVEGLLNTFCQFSNATSPVPDMQVGDVIACISNAPVRFVGRLGWNSWREQIRACL